MLLLVNHKRGGGRAMPIAIGLLLCVFHTGCLEPAPVHKKEYLQRFHEFSQDLQADCRNYSAFEQIIIDFRFRRFARDWYRLFSKELTAKERVDVIAYCGIYVKCRIDIQKPGWLEQVEDLLGGLTP